MKKKSLIAIALFFYFSANAQDTILKRNGDQLLSKILEISTTEVKYKKFDFQDGPNFIENKSNIKVIKYANGSKDEFELKQTDNKFKPGAGNTKYYSGSGPINPNYNIEINGSSFRYNGNIIKDRELHRILLNSDDPQINLLVDRARRTKKKELVWIPGVGLAGAGLGAIALGSIFNSFGAGGNEFFIVGGICIAAAIPFPILSTHLRRKRDISNNEAIKLYNAKF